MPKLLCTLPNASEEIGGVKFVAAKGGMLSEDVSEEVATRFAGIPGYEIVGDGSGGQSTKTANTGGAGGSNDNPHAELLKLLDSNADTVVAKLKAGGFTLEQLQALNKAEQDGKTRKHVGEALADAIEKATPAP